MNKTKVAVTIDSDLLAYLDRLIAEQLFPNRSLAIQQAVQEKIDRLERTRLARECAKLDPLEEQEMADEGLTEDFAEWPDY
ncbi:MAG: CopG family transcriptional regulator [Ardenticatenaceae bacterium]|nr:CopG family transcriptional regulator [Ardenticatenaceae bacterium]